MVTTLINISLIVTLPVTPTTSTAPSGSTWNLRPRILARKADVVFLGNSRMQVALSAEATGNWFSAISARYYLLGFSYGENVVMTEELLRKLQPRAKVYVINVDDFFERIETAPMKTILHEADARDRYETKRRWQHIHERICTKLSALCRSDYVIFRSRETGAYTKKTDRDQITPVSDDWAVDQISSRAARPSQKISWRN